MTKKKITKRMNVKDLSKNQLNFQHPLEELLWFLPPDPHQELIDEIKQIFDLNAQVSHLKNNIIKSIYRSIQYDEVVSICIFPFLTEDIRHLSTYSLFEFERFLPYGFPFIDNRTHPPHFDFHIEILVLNQLELQRCINEIQIQLNDIKEQKENKKYDDKSLFQFPIKNVPYYYKSSEIPTILEMLERCQVVSLIDPRPPLLK